MSDSQLSPLQREVACLRLSLRLYREHRIPDWRHGWPTWQEGPLYGLGWPAWKPSWQGRLMQVSVMLILLLLYLPLTVLYLLLLSVFRVVELWSDYRTNLKHIAALEYAISAHASPLLSLRGMWVHYGPDVKVMGQIGRKPLLAQWMTILYGQSVDYWSEKIDQHCQATIHATALSHAASLENENVPRLFFGDPIDAAVRTLDRQLGPYTS